MTRPTPFSAFLRSTVHSCSDHASLEQRCRCESLPAPAAGLGITLRVRRRGRQPDLSSCGCRRQKPLPPSSVRRLGRSLGCLPYSAANVCWWRAPERRRKKRGPTPAQPLLVSPLSDDAATACTGRTRLRQWREVGSSTKSKAAARSLRSSSSRWRFRTSLPLPPPLPTRFVAGYF